MGVRRWSLQVLAKVECWATGALLEQVRKTLTEVKFTSIPLRVSFKQVLN